MTMRIGVWLSTAHMGFVDMVLEAGIADILLDLEHGVFGVESVEFLVGTIRAAGARALLKTEAPTPRAVMTALDRGASGILIPQLRDAAHAKAVTAYAKYPPRGCRGASGGRVFGYKPGDRDFFGHEDVSRPCYAMIETAGALMDVDGIAALDTVDGLFVGPTDLALSRGRGCYRRDEQDRNDIACIAASAARAGKPWGFPAWTRAEQNWARELGAAFMTVADEYGAMLRGLRAVLCDVEQ